MKNYIFLMDPLEKVIIEKDTSFMFMCEADRRGHNVYFVPDGSLSVEDGYVSVNATQVKPQKDKENPFIIKSSSVISADRIDAVFVRTDPPFDEQYLMNTWILDLLPDHIPIINKPSGIRDVNEKVWINRFKDLIPPTYIGRTPHQINDFISRHNDVVVKPTNGFGGQSVFRTGVKDLNRNVIIESMTQLGQKDIIVQAFIPESQMGDKRILLLNGEVLGAVLRVHNDQDHRNNFFAGGKALKTEVTQRELDIIETLKPYLIKMGLYFVGIDVMGDYLIELNVTSPTCLQEINHFNDHALERDVLDFVETFSH